MAKTVEERDQEIIATIIGSARIEGLEVEPEVITDMKLICRGELTVEQSIKNTLERIRREQIR